MYVLSFYRSVSFTLLHRVWTTTEETTLIPLLTHFNERTTRVEQVEQVK